MKYSMDADAIIGAWNNLYRPSVLPGLWKHLAYAKHSLVIIKPVFEEIGAIPPQEKKTLSAAEINRKYTLQAWLAENQFDNIVEEVPDDVKAASLQWEREYQTNPNSKGAGPVDIHLIAHARRFRHCVVTAEARQPQRPGNPSNCKIPLICRDKEVECIQFIEMLEKLSIKVE